MSVKKTFLIYLKTHKLKTFLIILAILIVTIISLIPAQILKIIVDEILPQENNNLLLKYALLYVSLYIIIGLTTFIKDLIMLTTSLDTTACLKLNMMKHVEKLTYKELVKHNTGSLEAYFNNDVDSINDLFSTGVINMATDCFKIIGIIISIFIFSLSFGLIILIILPLLVIFTFFVKKRMLKAQLKTKSLESNVNDNLLESVENIEQIKVNKAYDYVLNKSNKTLNNHFKASQASNLYDALFSPVMQILRNIVIVSILLLSGYDLNILSLTSGKIIAGISLLSDLFTPIENLGMEIQTIQKSFACIKRINRFFKLEEEDIKNEYNLTNYDIIYDHVYFAYDDIDVIKNFSLTIKEKDKINLQGVSGSGKSTLIKLAMGLIKPLKGSVTIGGINNFALNDKMKKKLFAIVYQDPFFSGGTIYEEITLKDKTISQEDVYKALKKVNLEYITDINIKLNEKEYSFGELALFNIARIIVKDSKIIFLDEMNAKIDPLSAKKIINLINEIGKDKTIIFINHYGDTLDQAKIVKL